MLSKLKKIFNKDKIEAFNESKTNRKYGIHISQYVENSKYIVYVNDVFEDDTVIAILNNEEEVNEFISDLTAEISARGKQRNADIQERLVKDLNRLEYLHKHHCHSLFASAYKKTMFSVYLNKKIVDHINEYVETKIFGNKS